MKYAIAMVVVLAALALAVVWWRYRQWPPSLWASRVRRHAADLRGRLDQILHPRGGDRSEAERLADELFAKQIASVSVEVLKRSKGVGPKTVESLQNAGIRTLAEAEAHANAFLFKKKIQNLGEVREREVSDAVREILADERRRFDDGRSPQGEEYRRRMVALGAAERERTEAKARESDAIERCLAELRPLETLARDVTFSSYITKQPVRGLTPEVMAAELPRVMMVAASSQTSAPVIVAKPPDEPLPEVAKLQAYCRFGLLIAKADGRIAQSERGRIRVLLGEQFGSDPLLLRHLDPQLEAAEANLPSEDDAIAAIKTLTAKDDWRSLYAFAENIVDAAGERVEKETQFLARLADAFELEAAAPMPPEPVVSTACEVLGIPADTEITVDLVRRKYTMLTEQICPEKAAQLGPEFEAMAVQKRAAILAAAEELIAPFDVPLDPPAPPEQKNLRENSDLDDLFGSLSRG